MRRSSLLAVVAAPWIVASTSTTLGCPVCDTDAGRQVRAGIVGDDLALNVVAVVSPFAVVAAAAALIHFGPFGRDKTDGDAT